MSTPTFNLGLTMAGAVSAGAYTAGFMDYILEALSIWEEKKQGNKFLGKDHEDYDHSIPMHDVVIDVVGGASAGGMVSVMTALSLYKKMEPVKEKSYVKTGNILYDSWVLLDDDLGTNPKKANLNGKTTFEKMLEVDDITETKSIQSLLNTEPIDHVAEKVFNELPKKGDQEAFPSYISDDFRVLLTLCTLKPISYKVGLSRLKSAYQIVDPSHRINNHMLVAHFKTNFSEAEDKDVYLNFDPFEETWKKLIVKCTKATGAFPIGLKARDFENEFTTEYVKSSMKRSLSLNENDQVEFDLDGEFFDFTDVDGGTINNEPFDEVLRVLQERYGPSNEVHPRYGTVMIDPFPNFYNEKPDDSEPKFQKTIFDILPKLIGTLIDQTRVKRTDTFDRSIFKLMSFPVKWKKRGEHFEHPPLACGGIDGFGGFFGIDFRIHDFFLGRDNARNFLRFFFSLEYDAASPNYLFKGISQEAIDMFSIKKNNKIYIPILPDMNFIQAKIDKETNPYAYTVPTFPKLNMRYFKRLKNPIKNRIKAMLKNEVKNRAKGKFFVKLLLKIFTGKITNAATDKVNAAILKDFEHRKML